MELIKGIKERRSTRKFTDQAVSEEEIREIVSSLRTQLENYTDSPLHRDNKPGEKAGDRRYLRDGICR